MRQTSRKHSSRKYKKNVEGNYDMVLKEGDGVTKKRADDEEWCDDFSQKTVAHHN